MQTTITPIGNKLKAKIFTPENKVTFMACNGKKDPKKAFIKTILKYPNNTMFDELQVTSVNDKRVLAIGPEKFFLWFRWFVKNQHKDFCSYSNFIDPTTNISNEGVYYYKQKLYILDENGFVNTIPQA